MGTPENLHFAYVASRKPANYRGFPAMQHSLMGFSGVPISKSDAIVAIVLVSIGLLLMIVRFLLSPGFTDGNLIYAEIVSAHGTTIVHLDEDKIFHVPHVPNITFEVRDRQVAFIWSDCNDQICVMAGFQRRPGQMAACLPNGLILTVRGDAEIDIFVGLFRGAE